MIPASDDTFDLVLSGSVIVHVRRPWQWMEELARVCRPGGVVATVGPVSWPYHEAPVDCWRVYPEGMRALCEDAGLVVEFSACESLERPPGGGIPVPVTTKTVERPLNYSTPLPPAWGGHCRSRSTP